MTRPLQENQIGEFYVTLQGQSTVKSNTNVALLKLEKNNPSSTGAVLELVGSGGALPIKASQFSVGVNGDFTGKKLTLTNLDVDTLTSLSSSNITPSINLPNSIIAGNDSFVNNLNLNSSESNHAFFSALIVSGSSSLGDLNSNSIFNQGVFLNKGSLTQAQLAGFFGGVEVNSVANLSSSPQILSTAKFSGDNLIESSSPETTWVLRNNISSSNVGDASLLVDSNLGILSETFLKLKRGFTEYKISYSSGSKFVDFNTITNTVFTSRFKHANANFQHHVLADNLQISKTLNTENLYVSGSSSLSNLSPQQVKVSDTLKSEDGLDITGSLKISVKDSPSYSSNFAELAAVASGSTYQLMFSDLQALYNLSQIRSTGPYTAVIPDDYGSPTAAINAGEKSIFIRPGTYANTSGGNLIISADDVLITGANNLSVVWELSGLEITGNNVKLQDLKIKNISSGYNTFSVQGDNCSLSDLNLEFFTLELDQINNTKLSNLEFIIKDPTDVISLNQCSNLICKDLQVFNESSAISSGSFGIFSLEGNNSDIKLSNIYAPLSYLSGADYSVLSIGGIFDSLEIEESTARGINNFIFFNDTLAPSPGSVLNQLHIKSVTSETRQEFFNFDGSSLPKPSIQNMIIEDVVSTVLTEDTAFFKFIGGSSTEDNAGWKIRNIISNLPLNPTSTTLSYHFDLQTDLANSVLNRFNLANVSAYGNSFLHFTGGGILHSISNICFEGATSASLNSGDDYFIEYNCRSNDLFYVTFSGINHVSDKLKTFKLTTDGNNCRYIAFNHFCTRSNQTVHNSRGDFYLEEVGGNPDIRAVMVGYGNVYNGYNGAVFNSAGSVGNSQAHAYGITLQLPAFTVVTGLFGINDSVWEIVGNTAPSYNPDNVILI